MRFYGLPGIPYLQVMVKAGGLNVIMGGVTYRVAGLVYVYAQVLYSIARFAGEPHPRSSPTGEGV